VSRERVRMTFYRGSVDQTARAIEGALSGRKIPSTWKHLPPGLSMRGLEAEMPSPEGPPSGILFASPVCPEWACFASPSEDGWVTLVNAVSASDPTLEAVFVLDDAGEAKFPARGFEVFRGGRSIRKVRVWKDDGWHFVNTGPMLPFEDPSAYSPRIIANRLTSSALSDLLLKLEIDLWAMFDDVATDARLLTA